MHIAYTMAPGRGDMDLILEQSAALLETKGVRTCGTVQINSDRENCHACDMDVKVLPNGPVIRISQSLGQDSQGCRLNPSALEEAVGYSRSRLDQGVDVLIINKFGKHEAEGRGFRELIGEALAMEIPVLVGVNELNLPAFLEYTAGIAVKVSPEPEKIADWLDGCLKSEKEQVA
ncbi:DUF2478 domain-containing protein [Flexibacterium corallicola]|uniref:DUF2478 domain-containing protein n=1 Tax=Flexibacterium corallicola TaxID=3037259 RepID=UPI00286F613C|nr:DUF2478 domain-containing protein [Pseudovibrio sp. M1P-2-3]